MGDTGGGVGDTGGRIGVPGPALPGAGHIVDLLDGISIVPGQEGAREGAAVGAGEGEGCGGWDGMGWDGMG